jgi:Spinocerebellar ataxia type 10 protein domain
MANDADEDDVPHSSGSYEWKLILSDLRHLKKKELRCSAGAESRNTSSPLFVPFVRHFLLHQTAIQDHLSCREDMDRLEIVLRLALCYVSFPSSLLSKDCIEWRRTIQKQAFDSWHMALLKLIMDKDSVLPKCRQISAQVLCNTITDFAETAARLMRLVPTAPSQFTITYKIFAEQIQNATGSGTAGTSTATNWVDLMLASVPHRPTLAVVVACLHNCICTLSQSSDCRQEFVYPVAECTLLISTLLRHVISAAAALPRNSDQATTAKVGDTVDDATEWIALTVAKLCRLGVLPQVYQSIQPGLSSNSVLPEHVVLLHLVRNIIEEAPHNNNLTLRSFMLGGEVDDDDDGCGAVQTHRFLTSLYLKLRDTACSAFVGPVELQPTAIQLVLDILADSLAEESTLAAACRYVIGTETLLLQALVSDLAAVLDAWYETNKAVYTRHQTKLNETDQCRITASVRVLGNLCFHCAHNQDLLRETVVPYSSLTRETPNIEHTVGTSSIEAMNRSGLHVLLSTTSMSYSCFTLREWAVVAIRSALEECPKNQVVVAELETQSSVHSADLEQMGIRVNLDTAKGVVSVSPVSD